MGSFGRWIIALHLAIDVGLILLPLQLGNESQTFVFGALAGQASLTAIVPRLAGRGPAMIACVGLLGALASTGVWIQYAGASGEDLLQLSIMSLSQLFMILIVGSVTLQRTAMRPATGSLSTQSLLVGSGLIAVVLTLLRVLAHRWGWSISDLDWTVLVFLVPFGCLNAAIGIISSRLVGGWGGAGSLRWGLALAGLFVLTLLLFRWNLGQDSGPILYQIAAVFAGHALVVIATLACLPRAWVQTLPTVLD